MKIVVDNEGLEAIKVFADLYLKTYWLEGKQTIDYVLSNLKLQNDNNNNSDNVNNGNKQNWTKQDNGPTNTNKK